MNKPLTLIVTGVLLIVAAILLVAVIVPSQRVFPDDIDVIRDFDVAYITLLNPETLTYFEAPVGEANDVIIRRHVKVEDSDSSRVLVYENQSILDGDTTLEEVEFRYPLDRVSLEQVADVPEKWAALDGVWEREGLVIGWNVDGVRQADYVGWNEDTRETVDLVYEGEDTVEGMAAYKFTSHRDPQPIDPNQVAVLGMLPELTIDQVAQLAAGMEVDDPSIRLMLRMGMPTMLEAAVRETQDIPEDQKELTVPVLYFYDYDGQYWVEPTTGALLNTVKYEHRAATFPPEILDHLSQSVAALGMDPEIVMGLLPVTVSEYQYNGSAESIADAQHDARQAIDQLQLFGTTLPIILVVLGGLCVLGGGYGIMRGRS